MSQQPFSRLAIAAAPRPSPAAAMVLERFGLVGFGAHSNDAEYVLLDSIEPRLYLITRVVMDIARGKVGP